MQVLFGKVYCRYVIHSVVRIPRLTVGFLLEVSRRSPVYGILQCIFEIAFQDLLDHL